MRHLHLCAGADVASRQRVHNDGKENFKKFLNVRLAKKESTVRYELQTDDFLRLHLTVVLCRPGCGREVESRAQRGGRMASILFVF